jgi:hypothetical protein
LPPHAYSRHKLLAPGLPSCSQCPSRPPPAKKRGKSVHYSPHAIWFLVGICAKANWPFGEMCKW